ncbi:glutamyl-tRNA reductase [Flammeovirga sp. OC4]|uniref:glutamyl-tRNA reductase n=1 Tax=Flammeovirga sp. OC4 TaxID=1382345 RepID=UPI0005C45AD9|nr:glutamyl-tRNA reductase [Flammeovirga sp. OC4]
MTADLKLFSISHTKANVEIREKFALNNQEVRQLLHQFKEILSINEAMIYSSCNRTEIYYSADTLKTNDILQVLCAHKCLIPSEKYKEYVEEKESKASIKHLLCTGIGLNSTLLGDHQVFGQLKKSFEISKEEGMSKNVLNSLMERFIQFYQRISSETEYNYGITSNSYAAANIIQKEYNKDSNKKVLIIGVGEMGSDVCYFLSKFNTKNVWVTNRTMKKAKEMSRTYGFNSIDYGLHAKKLHMFDIILTTARQQAHSYKSIHFNNKPPQLVIDLCSPRTVSTEICNLGTKLLNVDDLGQQTDHTILRRKRTVPQVESIIEEETNFFTENFNQAVYIPSVSQATA